MREQQEWQSAVQNSGFDREDYTTTIGTHDPI